MRNWNSKNIRMLRESLVLSDVQRDALIGKILGDGSLISSPTCKNYRLQVEQKYDHKEYVYRIADIFGKWVLSPPKYIAVHNSLRFRTISHQQMTNFRKLFYMPDGRKIIPKNICNMMTDSLSVAVWFMDDGGLSTSGKAATISTHSFTKEENLLLSYCLEKNFGIRTNVHWDGKGFRLYVPVKFICRLRKVVLPHMPSVMHYKIPLTP